MESNGDKHKRPIDLLALLWNQTEDQWGNISTFKSQRTYITSLYEEFWKQRIEIWLGAVLEMKQSSIKKLSSED